METENDINSLIDEMIKSEYKNLNAKINKKDKIFLAGHNGMVGSAIYKRLKKMVIKKFITKTKKLNLLDQNKTKNFIKK